MKVKLFIFLGLLLVLSSFVVAQVPTLGYCLNPAINGQNPEGRYLNLEEHFCKIDAVTVEECCSPTFILYGQPGFPTDVTDCEDNYFDTVLADLPDDIEANCDLGCCFEPGNQDPPFCTERKQGICQALDPGNEFMTGFGPAEVGIGDACYKKDPTTNIVTAFDNKCSYAGAESCSDYTNDGKTVCRQSRCNWCDVTNSCGSTCSDCLDKPLSDDFLCTESQITCRESELNNQPACTAADCKWSVNNCDKSCRPGYTDPDNNGECDLSIDCRTFDDDEQTCLDATTISGTNAGCLWTITGTDSGSCSFECLSTQYVDDGNRVCEESNLCTDGGFVCADACLTVSGHQATLDSQCTTTGYECCEEASPLPQGCCEFSWQCSADINGGTRILKDFNSCHYDSTDEDTVWPCTQECFQESCANDFPINSPNNERALSAGQTHCWCGTQAVPLSSTDYCCDGSTQSEQCGERGSVRGTVINATGDLEENVNILILNTNNQKVGETITDASGNFFVEGLPYSSNVEYIILATKGQYQDLRHPVIFTVIDMTNIELTLILKDVGDCYSQNPPAPNNFDSSPIKGEKKVKLTWDYNYNPEFADCAGLINAIFLYKQVGDGFEYIILPPETTEYIDDGRHFGELNWGSLNEEGEPEYFHQTYDYQIKAHYITGVMSSEETSHFEMGDEICENIYADEEFCCYGSDQYCIPDGQETRMRRNCDENNKISADVNALTHIQNIDGTDVTSSCPPTYQCNGPNTLGETNCFKDVNCEALGNPFGVYYDQLSCYGIANIFEKPFNYCYYDESLTTIDSCQSCTSTTSCFDYKSESACVADSCDASGSYLGPGNCQWQSTFDSLGEGFCYDEDYQGTDYCSLCTDTGTIFNNNDCSQNVCSKLGSCHATEFNSCSACPEQPDCEIFETSTACENANGLDQSFETDNGDYSTCYIDVDQTKPIPTNLIASDDACNVGKCQWDTNNGECIKDSDVSGFDDCSNLQDESRINCLADNKPAFTRLALSQPIINSEGGVVTFNADGPDASTLQVCIGDDLCCPSENLNFESEETTALTTVTINSESETNTGGTIKTREDTVIHPVVFYSKDTRKNLEQVRESYTYIDVVAPIPNYRFIHSNDLTHNYLEMIVTSDEYLDCSYELENQEPPQISEDWLTGLSREFKIIFQDPGDGIYVFNITCYDDVENLGWVSAQTEVDWTQNLEGISVTGQSVGGEQTYTTDNEITDRIFNDNSVTFSFTTTDPAICNIQNGVNAPNCESSAGCNDLQSEVEAIPITSQDAGLGTYSYETTINNLISGTYVIGIICDMQNSAEEDTGGISFAIDTVGPITTALDENGEPFDFSPTKWYPNGVKLSLSCQDVSSDPAATDPREYGCKNIYYFRDTPDENTCPNSFYEDPDCDWLPYNGQFTLLDNSQLTQTHYLTYYSDDNGNNKESRAAYGSANANILMPIQIDYSMPSVEIFETNVLDPTNAGIKKDGIYYTRFDTTAFIDGRAIDLSGSETISEVKIIVTNGEDTTAYDSTVSPQTEGQTTYSFTQTINIEPGLNTVLAIAKDGAGNPVSLEENTDLDYVDGITINKDKSPPVSEQIDIKEVTTAGDIKIDDLCSTADCGNAEYGNNLKFEWTISDAGVGLKEDSLWVTSTCYEGDCMNCVDTICNPTQITLPLEDESNTGTFKAIYDTSINPPLEIGNYSSYFKADDLLLNQITQLVHFGIEDNLAPDIFIKSKTESSEFTYPIEVDANPKTVYIPEINITGYTDPETEVVIRVWDNQNELGTLDARGTSNSVVNPVSGLVDLSISNFYGQAPTSLIQGELPIEGEFTLYFDGVDYVDTIGPKIQVGQHIEFKDASTEGGIVRFEVPRYEVTSVSRVGTLCDINFPNCATRVQFNPPLRSFEMSNGWTATFYPEDGETPTGWFDIQVDLHPDPGQYQPNKLEIAAIDSHGNPDYAYGGTGPNDKLEIEYVSDSIAGITLNLPNEKYNGGLDNEVILERQANFTIKVTTDWASSCTISHTDDSVADTIVSAPMTNTSPEKTTHTFQPDCSLGFCNLGGFNIHHNYQITCAADEPGILDDNLDLCFVMVNNTRTLSGTEYNPIPQAICLGNSCSATITKCTDTAGADIEVTTCSTCSPEDSDPDCICASNCQNAGDIKGCGDLITEKPPLNLIARTDNLQYLGSSLIYPPANVYGSVLEISGITEANSVVNIVVRDSAGVLQSGSGGYNTNAAGISSKFATVGIITDYTDLNYPVKGEQEVYLAGQGIFDLLPSNPDLASNEIYIEFTNNNDRTVYEVERYRVTFKDRYEDLATIITLDKELVNDQLSDGGSAEFYNEKHPEGWFNKTIPLVSGLNNLEIRTTAPNGIFYDHYYSTAKGYTSDNYLPINSLPGESVKIYISSPGIFNNNYVSYDPGFTITATTTYPSVCKINHTKDTVADDFEVVMSPDESSETHTFTISDSLCNNNTDSPGKYCTVGGYQIFNNYNITCDPIYEGIESNYTDICVTVDSIALGNDDEGGLGNSCDAFTPLCAEITNGPNSCFTGQTPGPTTPTTPTTPPTGSQGTGGI